MLISDCLDPDGMKKGLQYLVGSGWDVFVIQVLSPEELHPLEHGMEGDLKLVNAESNEVCEVTVTTPLIEQYQSNLSSFCDDVRMQCTRIGAGNVRVSSDIDIELLLVEYLRNRGLLR
ncbi:MAG: hypothetical protein MK073_08235 [Phycisphaerales bacterium]|nr:hypothetical protein [Phycisphaerales bacterium]